MEIVDPIRNIRHIRLLKKELKKTSSRDYCFFVLGINTGLKINTMLQLRTDQLMDDAGKMNVFIEVNGQRIYLNEKVRTALTHHLIHEGHAADEFLFHSPKSGGPISRQQAYRVIHNAARQIGIDDQIGTHTIRKTFGYHAYIKGIAISLIQKRYNHSSPSETLRYIGFDQAELKLDVNL
ncbi:tyrosine-type recombinase/integrase [Jeotgalibacillus malaysiensis]|uniref:tyrosine-type recombinase/integrase n=1 Tax=Jeotgalibacillus malaysiensis TaxID=1508404 RepID=UPI003850B53F